MVALWANIYQVVDLNEWLKKKLKTEIYQNTLRIVKKD